MFVLDANKNIEQAERAPLTPTFISDLDWLFGDYFQVNRLTKCDTCTALKEEKEKTMDKNVRKYLDELYKLHNNLQM